MMLLIFMLFFCVGWMCGCCVWYLQVLIGGVGGGLVFFFVVYFFVLVFGGCSLNSRKLWLLIRNLLVNGQCLLSGFFGCWVFSRQVQLLFLVILGRWKDIVLWQVLRISSRVVFLLLCRILVGCVWLSRSMLRQWVCLLCQCFLVIFLLLGVSQVMFLIFSVLLYLLIRKCFLCRIGQCWCRVSRCWVKVSSEWFLLFSCQLIQFSLLFW